jgi:hypothetical protein
MSSSPSATKKKKKKKREGKKEKETDRQALIWLPPLGLLAVERESQMVLEAPLAKSPLLTSLSIQPSSLSPWSLIFTGWAEGESPGGHSHLLRTQPWVHPMGLSASSLVSSCRHSITNSQVLLACGLGTFTASETCAQREERHRTNALQNRQATWCLADGWQRWRALALLPHCSTKKYTGSTQSALYGLGPRQTGSSQVLNPCGAHFSR